MALNSRYLGYSRGSLGGLGRGDGFKSLCLGSFLGPVTDSSRYRKYYPELNPEPERRLSRASRFKALSV